MKNNWKLLLISLVGLYLEMCFIRWISAEIRVFAYAKNLVLLACYLGFGLGNFLAHKRSIMMWSLAIMAGLVVLIEAPYDLLSAHSITYAFSQFSDLQIMGGTTRALTLNETLLFGVFGLTWVLAVFLALVVMFIPYGQLLGRYLNAHGNNLRAYSINILGSIVGIWMYTTLSFLLLPPFIWLVLGMLVSIYFLPRWRERVVALVLVAVAAAFLWPNWGRELWSSYQKLEIHEQEQVITVNGVGYMSLKPMAAAGPGNPEAINRWNMVYYFRPQPRDVLIVGAGAGNDAAAALAAGAGHVVAVEIDPAVHRLGRQMHPDRPYHDPRVQVVIDDARHYLSTTDRKFDVIVFSHLDAHTLLSGFTNVRLDNYIYTVESLGQANALLKDDGVIYLAFWANRPWIRDRLYNNLEAAVGHPPFLISSYEESRGTDIELVHFFSGTQAVQREIRAMYPDDWPGFFSYVPEPNRVPILTDDWPYLYIEQHSIPRLILLLMGTVTAFSLVFVCVNFKRFGRGGRLKIDWHFFFLGAAFLLVETHNVGKLALIFGTTWIVNSWVISAVLLLILLANILVERYRLPSPYIAYGGLTVSLLLGYFIPASVFIALPGALKALGAVTLYTLPVFFAGIVFSTSFAKSRSPDQHIGSNMIGAILGGLLESFSFISGIRSLFLIALALYLLSLWSMWARSRSTTGG
jgi:SAM-dependent methyltransferase